MDERNVKMFYANALLLIESSDDHRWDVTELLPFFFIFNLGEVKYIRNDLPEYVETGKEISNVFDMDEMKMIRQNLEYRRLPFRGTERQRALALEKLKTEIS